MKNLERNPLAAAHPKNLPGLILAAFFWFLAALLFYDSAFCQPVAGNVLLENAWQIAVENNLTLKEVEKVVLEAEEEIKVQKTNYLPTLTASGSFNFIGDLQIPIEFQIPGLPTPALDLGDPGDIKITALNVTLQQPVFTGFRTRNIVRAARSQKEAGIAQQKMTRNALFLQIGQLYYQVQSNRLQQEVIERSIQRANNQLEKVRSLYQADQATYFDTLQVSNRKLQLQIELKNLQNINRILESKFRYLLNLDSTIVIANPTEDREIPALLPLSDYQVLAVSRRPELIRLSHVKMGKKYQEKALKSTLYPQLYASAAQYFVYPSGSFFKEKWMDFYVLGVNLKWEFWNWGRDLKKARQSRYEYERLDLQQMDLIKQIRQQVEETYLSLNNIRERILMQKKLLFQEQKRFQITENKYIEGQATALDVSDAENRLTEAELTLDNYYTEWNRTMLQMEFFTGTIGNKNFEVTQ